MKGKLLFAITVLNIGAIFSTVQLTNAQTCSPNFTPTGLYDDFTTKEPSNTDKSGIYNSSVASDNSQSPNFKATITRDTTNHKLNVSLTQQQGQFAFFKTSFGNVGGSTSGKPFYTDLSKNSDFSVNITNKSLSETIKFRMVLVDSAGKEIDTYADYSSDADFSNAWKYTVEVTINPGKTVSLTGSFANGAKANWVTRQYETGFNFKKVAAIHYIVYNQANIGAPSYDPLSLTNTPLTINSIQVGDCAIAPTISKNEYSNFTTFNVDMTSVIYNGLFDPSVDKVDVAGTFNGWPATGNIVTPLKRVGSSTIYSFQTDTLTDGNTIEFKFRINGDWSNSELQTDGSSSNRGFSFYRNGDVYNTIYDDRNVTVTNPFIDGVFNINGSSNICQGDSIKLYTSPASNYLWTTGEKTPSITVRTSGNYSVTSTNSLGIKATSFKTNVTVLQYTSPTITPSGPTTFCKGSNITLTANASGMYYYKYYWNNSSTNNTNITVDSSGTYVVNVLTSFGTPSCYISTASIKVIVNPSPVSTITSNKLTNICKGDSVSLVANSNTSYLWSTGATTSSISVKTPGNYTVKATNTFGCSTTSAITPVTINPNNVSTVSNPSVLCAGKSTTLTFNGVQTFTLMPGNISGTSKSQIVMPPLTTKYIVSGKDLFGCSYKDSTIVTVNDVPVITTQPIDQTTKLNSTVTFSVTASGSNTFQWQQNNGTGFADLSNAGSYSGVKTNLLNISNTSSTINNSYYRCIIKNGNCQDTSNTVTLMVGSSTGINSVFNNNSNVVVSPNPSNGIVTFSYPEANHASEITIFNMLGAKIYEGGLQTKSLIDLTNHESGLYFYRIIESDRIVSTGKIIIQ